MNTTTRIKLIDAMFRISDCDTICYTSNGYPPESVDLKREDWDGGDLPFRGGSVPHVYALCHLKEPEVKRLHEYASLALDNSNLPLEDGTDVLKSFWERPENVDFESVFLDVLASLNPSPDELLRLKPGDEYWIDGDWGYADLFK